MPDSVFLNANVVYSAAHSPASAIRRLWSLPETEFLASPYVVDEVLRSLPVHRHVELQVLLEAITLVPSPPVDEIVLPSGLVLPEKDAPIFQAAALAGATHLITGDKRHFGPYFGSRFEGVLILSPRRSLESRFLRLTPTGIP